MSKLTVRDLPVEGKKVFVRVDFNVPLSEDGLVLDDTRMRASLPTLNYLVDKNAKIIIASHLGRPMGKVVEELKLDPVAERLSQLLGRDVLKVDSVIGEEVEQAIAKLPPGGILLLDNIRFEPGEEKNEPEFARKLAHLADYFVNDAFGTAHRAHASTCGIAEYIPAAAGLLMEKEILYLEKSKVNPARPLVAILGGRKVADKIGVIRFFLQQADNLLLGGAMANTFLKASGISIGESLYEEDKLEMAREVIRENGKKYARIILPKDVVIVEKLESGARGKEVNIDEIPEGWSVVDIGSKTLKAFQDVIAGSETVIWNGPLGAYEVPPFNRGTIGVARAVANSGAESITGGGDIVAALASANLTDKITHISTGGGAVLKFWEGKELPGLNVLQERSVSRS